MTNNAYLSFPRGDLTLESVLESMPKKKLLALAAQGLDAMVKRGLSEIQRDLNDATFGPPEKPEKTRAAKTATKPKRRKKGQKRSPERLAAMKREIVGIIKAEPGISSETLRRHLDLEARELALPLRQVVAEKLVQTTGRNRATKYFAGLPKKARPAKTKTRTARLRKAVAKPKPSAKLLNGAAATAN